MSLRIRSALGAAVAAATVTGLMVAAPVARADTTAGTTVRVSNNSGTDGGREQGVISSDGRYVAFIGRNRASQGVYVVDRLAGTTQRVSNALDQHPAISPDGRDVAYAVYGSNRSIYLFDRVTGTTTMVSVNSDGSPAAGISDYPSVSANGRYVAFQTTAQGLGGTPAATGGSPSQIYVYDTTTGVMTPVSATTSGGTTTLGNANSVLPAITPDGHDVVFASAASNLVATTVPAVQQIYVHDMTTGTNTLVSVDSNGVPGDGASAGTYGPSISASGNLVAFESDATNLVAGDTNGQRDAFVHELSTGTTTRVSLDAGGAQVTAPAMEFTASPVAGANPQLSGDGQYVAFESNAALTPDDTNGVLDVYERNLATGALTRVSVPVAGGTEASGTRTDGKTGATVDQVNGSDDNINYDGRYVSFLSNGDLAADRPISTEGATTGVSTEGAVFVRTTNLPAVTSVSPTALGRGRTAQTVTITGSNFTSPTVPGDLVVSLGSGITTTSVTWVSSTQLTAVVDVSPTTSTGTRDVVVTNPGSDSATLAASVTVVPRGTGYRMAASDGGVFDFGDSVHAGSMGGVPLNAPVVELDDTPSGNGYWLVASDGGVFSFGDAAFHGSMGGQTLNQPIVAMAATRDGAGYWLLGADGGIFAFGDAPYYGSLGANHLGVRMVGIATTLDGHGYWLAASDGEVFGLGDANVFGTAEGFALKAPIVGIAATPDQAGYWLLGADGGVFAFGDAAYLGSMGGATLNQPMVAMVGD